jgi:hypothetical protein
MKAVLVIMFGPLVCSLAQSNLDVPAKAEVATVRSEIKRGCDEVAAAELPDDPEERWDAAKRIINENDRIGRKTNGFVLGVHFRIWLALEIAWEIYPAGSSAKLAADGVGGTVWNQLQQELSKTGLTMAQLIEASQLSGGDVNQRIERWKKRDAQ